MPKIQNKSTFEDNYETIVKVVKSKVNAKWALSSIQWLDCSDVESIIVIHIYKKFDKWDRSRPLIPWINVIINHQISNLIRNHYSSFSRPCLKCEYNEGENACSIYQTQCKSCPLYAKWDKFKKHACNVKIPLPIHNHEQEAEDIMHHDNFDLEKTSEQFHKIMEKELKPLEWKIYKLMFIQDKNEEQIAQILGYKTSEENRIAGYRTIYAVKKRVIEIAKQKIRSNEVDY